MNGTLDLLPSPKALQTRETFVETKDSVLGKVQVADELGFAYLDGDIDFGATGAHEIYQCIKYIILTEYFSVPLDREFGMNYSMVDKPIPIAEAILSQEVAMKIALYEPRAQFREISFVRDMLVGKLSPTVRVVLLTINELPSSVSPLGSISAVVGGPPGKTIEEVDLPGFYETLIEFARVPGPPGPIGPAATIEVGTTTTGAPGTDAEVSNSGSVNAAIFDFLIPEGEKGDKGDQGTGITVKGTVPNSGALPTTGNQPGDMWIAADTGHGWTWNGTAWVDAGPIQGPPGGSTSVFEYMFSSTITEPPTGSEVRLNNANQQLATLAWVRYNTADGTDVAALLKLAAAGMTFYIQDKDESAKYQQYNITGATVDKTTYAQISISWVKGGTPVTAQRVLVGIVHTGPVGPPGPTGDPGPVGPPGQIWRGTWNAATNYVANDAVEYQGSTFICTGPNINEPPVPSTASNWLPPLANTGNRGSLAALPASNQIDCYARADNTWQSLRPVIWAVRMRSFNAIGNPTFEIDQRNAGSAFANIGNNAGIVDRYILEKSGTMTVDGQQAVNNGIAIPGTSFFVSAYQYRLTLGAQQASLGTNDILMITQKLEGIQWRELAGDVSSISLLVSSTIALKFCVTIRSPDTTQSLVKLVNITTPNTWTLVTLPNIPKPTGGNFSVLPGVQASRFHIVLACGSAYIAPATDVWQNGNFLGASGMDNWASKAVGSAISFAFVQHEPGPECTMPIDCPWQNNYHDCLRYYCKSYDYAVKPGTVSSPGGSIGAQQVFVNWGTIWAYTKFPRNMAKVPSVVGYNPVTGASNSVRDIQNSADRAIASTNNAGETAFAGFNITGQAATGTPWYQYHYAADTGW